MAVRAPLPKAGIFKQATRRPRARDKQIGSDCDTRTPVSQRVLCATRASQTTALLFAGPERGLLTQWTVTLAVAIGPECPSRYGGMFECNVLGSSRQRRALLRLEVPD